MNVCVYVMDVMYVWNVCMCAHVGTDVCSCPCPSDSAQRIRNLENEGLFLSFWVSCADFVEAINWNCHSASSVPNLQPHVNSREEKEMILKIYWLNPLQRPEPKACD